MYSVDDLLISHGYKLPQKTSTSPPAASPTPPSSYDNKRYGDPSSCRQEILESRSGSGHGTVNGYEIQSGPGLYVYSNSISTSRRPQPPAPTKGGRDRNSQPQRREADSGNQGDAHSLGDSLTTDSGFCEGPRGVYHHRGPRDLSYWRRRGQDFSILLDYADFREPRGGVTCRRTEGVQQQQRQEVPPEDCQQREKQSRAAQSQAQAQARSRQREAALQQWRMTAVDRKCQSLGTDEWRPAVVSFSCQLSDSEGERWSQAQEQYLQQRHLRTPDGAMVVIGPRNKGKSQSLPKMLQPDSLQYVEMSGSIGSGPGQDVHRRVNGHPGFHYDPYSIYNHNQARVGDSDRWPENDNRPSSQMSMTSQVSQVSQASQVPKVRYSRPLRPPSYEVHQQTRGSAETLSGDPEAASTPQPQDRDRTPLPHPSIGDPRLDYYTQDGGSGTEPPGYIPPPSYPPKRAPRPMRGSHGGHRGYGEVPVNYRYHQMYQQQQKQQMRGTPDPWFGSRHTGGGGSWPEPHRERSAPHRKQHYTGYSEQQHQPVLGPDIQYIPFDDPRLRHVSGGGNSSPCDGGDSTTDADKIRHIRNSTSSELPGVTVSDHSSDDSAFLSSASTGAPPPLASTPDPASPMPLRSPSDYDNNNNRWRQQQQHCDLHKETGSLDDFPAATSQNCNRYNPKPNQGGPAAFQPPAPAPPVCHSSSSDQGFSETTITQVKKIVPGDSGVDNLNRNSKRKAHSETIFCLVSVPIHMQQTNKDSISAADQNNNENMPASLPSILPIVSVIATVDNQNTVVQSKSENSQSLCSKSLSDMGLKPPSHTSSFTSMRSTRKGPLRKEIVDAWSLQASADKELCYAGSWPGDQYRNQETQTSSPVAVKGPGGTGGTGQLQSSPGGQGQGGQEGQETGHPASDTTMDSGAGTDCSSGSYGVDYPMKGQKNLHPSSNSAFSCLSISPAQPLSLPPQPVPGEWRNQQTSTSRKTGTTTSNTTKPPVSANANIQGQVAFGQFLLKPVSRRPWDAIEELESFNKAAGVDVDQVQKKMKVQPRRPSVDQCIDDLDEVYRTIMELSGEDTQQQQQQQHQHIAPPHLDPERETVSLPDQRLNNKPNNNIPTIMPRLDSWGPGSTIDHDYREVRSAFSRPQPQSRTSILRLKREDMVPTATLTESTGFKDYNSHNDPRVTYDSRLTYRQEQDISVAKESLLRDVGLTVSTEVPGGTVERGQHCGRPFTLITPLDHNELCPNVQLSRENRDGYFFAKNNQVEVVHISDGNNKEELGSTKVVEGGRKVKKDNVPIVPPRFRGHEPNLNIRRARSENSRSPRGEGSQGTPHIGRLTREAALAFEDDDYRYSVSSDPLSWRNEATLADIHLETLLIKEKANTMPTEDLSNLYEVKCAKGIPENETMEQRAARILGIDVAPDSLRGMVQVREEEQREEEESLQGVEEEQREEVSLQGVVEEREEDRQEYREDEGKTVIGETQERRDNTETEIETQELSPEGAHAVESLGGVEQKAEEHRDNPENETLIGETLKHSPDEDRDTKHVRRGYEQVMKVRVSVVTLEEETIEQEEETRGGPSKDDSLSVCEDKHDGGDRERLCHPSMMLDLPEFPPSSLPLSLPVTPDEELALSLLSVGGGGERKGHVGGASPRLSSSMSPCCTKGMVHLDEVFSVSCVLIRSLDSGEPAQETETEVVGVVQVEAEQDKDEGMSQGEREEMEEEELRIESEPEPEGKEIDRADKREDERIVSGEEKELEELKIEEKEQELTIEVGKELKVRMEEEKRRSQEEEEREVQEGEKEPEEEEKTERQVEEEEKEPEVEREEERSEKSDKKQQQEVRPEPVSRSVKPPLLPKPVPMPRSGTVAKREITFPLSFSVSSCGSSTTLEEDELLSDSYDPSRVERV